MLVAMLAGGIMYALTGSIFYALVTLIIISFVV